LHEGAFLPPAGLQPGPDHDPLIRTGERGSGEFREATWEEALDHVAGELKRIGGSYGYESIHVFGQVPGSGYVHKGANYRASAVLGMTHGTSFDYNGDLPMAMPITFGVQNAEHEAKDWANARFLLIVGANPLETRIPDATSSSTRLRTARGSSSWTPYSARPRARPTRGSG